MFGNWYIYHYILKENKDLETDKSAHFKNSKDILWLIPQWFESTLSALVSKLPPGGGPSCHMV